MNRDTSIFEDMLKPQSEEEYPCIYAKRLLKHPRTGKVHDKGTWEGLEPTVKNGRKSFRVVEDFVLIIDGATGHCKIPDTPKNRERLEFLSKPRKAIDFKRERNFDLPEEHPNAYKEVEVDVVAQPMYEMLEKSTFQKSQASALKQEILAELRKEFDIMPKGGVKAKAEEDDILEPL